MLYSASHQSTFEYKQTLAFAFGIYYNKLLRGFVSKYFGFCYQIHRNKLSMGFKQNIKAALHKTSLPYIVFISAPKFIIISPQALQETNQGCFAPGIDTLCFLFGSQMLFKLLHITAHSNCRCSRLGTNFKTKVSENETNAIENCVSVINDHFLILKHCNPRLHVQAVSSIAILQGVLQQYTLIYRSIA